MATKGGRNKQELYDICMLIKSHNFIRTLQLYSHSTGILFHHAMPTVTSYLLTRLITLRLATNTVFLGVTPDCEPE